MFQSMFPMKEQGNCRKIPIVIVNIINHLFAEDQCLFIS